MHPFSREERIIGKIALEKLQNSHVAVFGLGGVGSYIVESLARAGVGKITIIDYDKVDITNINRQLPALHSTIGEKKVDVIRKRLQDINPDLKVVSLEKKYDSETTDSIFSENFDYVADAIDMVTSKLLLIRTCYEKNIPIISSMGTGNKINPTMLEITTLDKTSVCPLAKVMRKELKKDNIKKLRVVYSKETPIIPNDDDRRTPGSISFVPSVAGLFISSEIIKHLANIENK